MGRIYEQIFFQRRHTDGQQAHEKILNITNHQEMLIKTIRYHLILMIKKTRDNRVRGCGEKRTLIQCWLECKLVQPLCKVLQRVLKKLKTELPQGLEISLLSFFLKKTKTLIQKDTCTPCSPQLFTTAKIWQQSKCPSVDEQVKIWFYTQNSITQKVKICQLQHGWTYNTVLS